MNIRYEIKGNKQIKNIYIRLYQGKFDVCAPVGLFVLEEDWNWQTESSNSDDLLNIKLQELKLTVLKEVNQSFSNGSIITSETLKSIVKEQFNRPTNEIGLINQDKDVYLSDFASFWIENHSKAWKVSAKKFMSKVQISQYKKVIEQLSEYEKFANCKLTLKDLTVDEIYQFANWYEENDYNNSTIKRNIGRLQFFLNRAIEEGIKVSNAHKQRIYIESDSDELESVYLNETELELLHNRKEWKSDLFSEEDLENAKDNLVLSCYTSLRISDFMHGLDTSKIKDNQILIRTQKTKQFSVIPLHKFVKEILSKRFGNLPKKFDNHTYNLMIKECCRIVKIEEQIFGKLWDKGKKRKVKGYWQKWQMISSHCGRKSFISNLKGKVSDNVLMSIGAWKSNEMMAHYNKTSKSEYAEQLNQYWNGK